MAGRSPNTSSDSSPASESPTEPSAPEPERGRSISMLSRRAEKWKWKARTDEERVEKERRGESNDGWGDKRLAEAKIDARDWAK